MDAILATAPAIQVNINAVAGYLMLAGLTFGLITMVGVLFSIKRQTAELHSAHLGTQAIDPSTGLPRWYYSHAFTEALEGVSNTLKIFAEAVASFTTVQRELIQELRLDRVERKARLAESQRATGASP